MDQRASRLFNAVHRKVHISAVFESDTSGIVKLLNNQEQRGHRGPHDWNDSMMTTVQSELAVVYKNEAVGGVGVAGGNSHISVRQFSEFGVRVFGGGFGHKELADLREEGRRSLGVLKEE